MHVRIQSKAEKKDDERIYALNLKNENELVESDRITENKTKKKPWKIKIVFIF